MNHPISKAYPDEPAPTIQPKIGHELGNALQRAYDIRNTLRDHHASLFGATPQPMEKAETPPASNTLGSLRELNEVLMEIQDKLEHAGSFL